MKRVTLDADLRSRLDHLSGQVEFCDELGRTVGFAIPANDLLVLRDDTGRTVGLLNPADGQDSNGREVEGDSVASLQAECERLRERVAVLEKERGQILVAWSRDMISDEELERRSRQPGGRPLAEFLKELEAR